MGKLYSPHEEDAEDETQELRKRLQEALRRVTDLEETVEELEGKVWDQEERLHRD